MRRTGLLIGVTALLMAPVSASARTNPPPPGHLVVTEDSGSVGHTYLADFNGRHRRIIDADATSISPDGRWLLAVNDDDTALVLTPVRGGASWHLGHAGETSVDPNSLTWATNSRALFVAANYGPPNGSNERWLRYDLSTGRVTRLAALPHIYLLAAEPCPNGRTAAVVDNDGNLTVLDMVTGKRRQRFALGGVDSVSLSWLPDCSAIFAAVTLGDFDDVYGGYVERIDLPRVHRITISSDDGIGPFALSVSPDGRYVFAIDDEILYRAPTLGGRRIPLTKASDGAGFVAAGG